MEIIFLNGASWFWRRYPYCVPAAMQAYSNGWHDWGANFEFNNESNSPTHDSDTNVVGFNNLFGGI